MSIERKASADATTKELAEYLSLHGVEVPAKLRGSKSEMIELITKANLPDPIIVASKQSQPPIGQTLTDDSEYDSENERWCRVRVGADPLAADGKESVQPVINGDQIIWLKRNSDVVFRERFLVVLKDAVETRKAESTGDEVTRLAEAADYQVARVPHTLVGFYGRVADGPPAELPPGVSVIH